MMLTRGTKLFLGTALALACVLITTALPAPSTALGIFESIKTEKEAAEQTRTIPVQQEEDLEQPGDKTDIYRTRDFVVYRKDTLWDAMKRRFTDARLNFKDFIDSFFLASPSVELTARHFLFPPLYSLEHFKKAREEFAFRRQVRKEADQAKRTSYDQAMEQLEKVLSLKTGDSKKAEKTKDTILNSLLKSGIPPKDVEKYMEHVEKKISSLKKAEEKKRQKKEERKQRAKEEQKRREEEARRKEEEANKKVRDDVMNTPQRSQLEAANGQYKNYWCGPTSLAMVYEYYGRNETTRDVANRIYDFAGNSGTYAGNIVSDAKKNGFPNTELKTGVGFDFLEQKLGEGKPVIVGVEVSYPYGHYMVVVGLEGDKVIINDPFHNGVRREMSRSAFLTDWNGRWRRTIVLEK